MKLFVRAVPSSLLLIAFIPSVVSAIDLIVFPVIIIDFYLNVSPLAPKLILSSVFNYVFCWVMSVFLLLFLNISLICLKVSQEFERLVSSSFLSSFKRLDLLELYLLSFSFENMLFSIENPPLDSDFGLYVTFFD
jgi:hypothetical protein